MAEITSQEQFERVRQALKSGEFADDPAIEDEILAAAEAWKSAQTPAPIPEPTQLSRPLPGPLQGIPSTSFAHPDTSIADIPQGIGEAGLNLLTSAGGAAPAGFSGLLSLNTDDPGGAVERTQENLTFQPRSRTGQDIAAGLTVPFQLAEQGADFLGEGVSRATNPAIGAGFKTALLGIPSLLGTKAKGGLSRNPLTNQQEVLLRAQERGYTVPASSANPASTTLSAVEGVAGKPRMQQQASFRNQEVTNRIVAEELQLPPGTQITREALDGVRAEAGRAYQVLDNVGDIQASVLFRRDLARAVTDLKAASKDFPVLAKKDSPVMQAIEMARGLNQQSFSSSSVAPVTRILRDEAATAFRNGQNQVGNAYRKMSKAIEDAAESHLIRTANSDALQAFRASRERIAKSYSVEKALDGDGFVSAPKLAAQLKKREPLSGGLRDIAEFAEQFPKSARVMKELPTSTGRLSGMLGAAALGGSAAAGSLAGIPLAAVAFGGPLTRALTLSKVGQKTVASPRGTLPGLLETTTGNAASGLLSDQQ